MTNRIKLKTPFVTTRADMEALVGQISALKIEEQVLKAAMDSELLRIRNCFESDLADIASNLGQKMSLAQDWAEDNPAEFGTAKSIDMTHGIVGWRLGNPTLKPISGWTWKRVLEHLVDVGSSYIRTKTEVDKAGIIADRDTLGDDMRELGCRVVQDDVFYVEPKVTETETTIKNEAA